MPMTGRHLLSLGLMLTTTAVAACTSGNTAIKDETRATIVSKLTQGASTEGQVRAMYGEPTRTIANNGTVRWIYSFGASQPGVQNFIPGVSIFSQNIASQGKVLDLSFGVDGVLQDYTFSETNNNVHRGI